MDLTKKNSFYFLCLLWIAVQGFLFYHHGIVTKGESVKYMQEADYFLQYRHFTQPKYIFYSTCIFIHVISQWIGTGIIGVYIFQLVLNLTAMFCFNLLAYVVSHSAPTAYLATLLLIICFPWQMWTTHLYTESIFLSLEIIFLYFLFKKSTNGFYSLFTISIFLLLLFSRPTGLFFIPALAVFFFVSYLRERKFLVASILMILFIMGFGWLLNYAMKGEGEFDFMKPFIEEHIICGVPSPQHATQLVLPADGNSIQGITYFILHNPVHFLQLSFHRILVFFGMIRGYYSTIHNLYLGAFFYPLYLFSLLGMWTYRKSNKPFLLFAGTCLLIFAASVALTCDDWLNRFIMPVIPLIIFFASQGIMLTKNAIGEKS